MWVIVSQQRSGTHLLTNLLNTHPDLRGQGELIGLGKPLPEFPLGKGEGFIAMYNQIIARNFYDRLKDAKIIHLTRNLDDTAYSLAILQDKDMPALTHEPTVVEVSPISQERLERLKQSMRRRRKVVMEHLDGDIFDITYEYICGGNKEIRELPKERATALLEFLGVEPMTLTVALRKWRYRENSN